MRNLDSGGKFSLVVVFAVFLLVPSFDTALKYFGVSGVIGYFLFTTLAIIAVFRFIIPVFIEAVSDKTADYLALTLLTLLAVFAMYMGPVANSGKFGSGSDADDALLIAVGELTSGRYPYYVSTYLGNRIGPMPGSILFAAPFALTGLIQLQNVFWLGAFFLTVRSFQRSSRLALALLSIILLFSPTVLQNIATGADYVSNTIFVMVSMWLLIRGSAGSSAGLTLKASAAAVLLGIGLSSRSTFLLLIPLLLSVLVQNGGWKNSIKYLSISGLIFLLITVPFWLYDPAGFAPLHVQGAKLTTVESILPYARIILPISATILSVVLSFQRMQVDCARFFLNCAIVQLFILLFTAVLYSIKLQRVDLYIEQSGYGMFTLFFGVTALWIYLSRTNDVVLGQLSANAT